MIEPDAVIRQLNKLPGAFEACHKSSFRLYRHDKDDRVQEVAVEILDAGADAGYPRYYCVATTDDGRAATGNPAPSIEQVLAMVHWWELDRDKSPTTSR